MNTDTPARSGAGDGSAGPPVRPDSALPTPEVTRPGRNEFGAISINDRVVERIAARAVTEIPDAGGAAPRLLGRSLAGLAAASPSGIRETSLDALPKSSADVDGSLAVLDLSISVRWPASVPAVTTAVRNHVRARITEFTGLTVLEVQIKVTDLVTRLPPPPRVI
jgi:uncharacterized alkaline shock family protein YloU